MATAEAPATKVLLDGQLKERLQELRRTDNTSNIPYVLRTYLYLLAVIAGTLWFYQLQADMAWSWWWNVPVTIVAFSDSSVISGSSWATAGAERVGRNRDRACGR